MARKRSGGSSSHLTGGIRSAASMGDWGKVMELAKQAQRQDAKIVEMRRDGKSIFGIAKVTGLSTTAVRAKVKQAGLPVDTRGAHATRQREEGDAAVAERSEEVLGMYRDGLDAQAIASETGLTGASVRRFLRSEVKDSDRAKRSKRGRPVEFDDESIRQTLRLVAASLGKVPTGPEYDRATTALRDAGLKVPASSTIRQRSGLWSAALRDAGLLPSGRRQRWADGRVEAVMRSWVEANGRVPRSPEWTRIARESNGSLPSCPVVMDRMGGTWTSATRIMEGWLR